MIAIHKETFGLYCVDLIIGWEGVRTDVFFFFFGQNIVGVSRKRI